MVRTVGEAGPHVDERVARDDAALHRFLDAGVDRGDVLAGDHAALDLVDELVAAAGTGRLERDARRARTGHDHRSGGRSGLSTFSTGWVIVSRYATCGLPTCASTLNSRIIRSTSTSRCSSPMPADDRLAGLVVGVDPERRVLVGERAERLAELVLVGLRLGLDRDRDDGLGEDHLLEDDRVRALAERVAGGRLLEAEAGDDVARVRDLDVLALVRVHAQDAPDALLAVLGRVVDLRALLELARVDAEVGELAVRVGDDLERERGERLVLARLALDRLALHVDALGGLAGRAATAGSRRPRRAWAARPCS